MQNKIVYLSYPISGYDIEERREYAKNLKRSLEHFYKEIKNPLENGLPVDTPTCDHMRADFKMLLEADVIFMCEGWEESSGCVAEWTVAKCCHMDIKYESDTAKYFR